MTGRPGHRTMEMNGRSAVCTVEPSPGHIRCRSTITEKRLKILAKGALFSHFVSFFTGIWGWAPEKLSVNSPALILSKNSGVYWLKSAQNRLKSAQNWLELAQNWLILAKIGPKLAK